MTFKKLLQSNSFIYFCIRDFALSNKKKIKSLRHSIVELYQKQNQCKIFAPPVVHNINVEIFDVNTKNARNMHDFVGLSKTVVCNRHRRLQV